MCSAGGVGDGRKSVCWELHEYTEKVLSRVIEDDRHFGVVYGLDEGDAWENRSRRGDQNAGCVAVAVGEDSEVQGQFECAEYGLEI